MEQSTPHKTFAIQLVNQGEGFRIALVTYVTLVPCVENETLRQ